MINKYINNYKSNLIRFIKTNKHIYISIYITMITNKVIIRNYILSTLSLSFKKLIISFYINQNKIIYRNKLSNKLNLFTYYIIKYIYYYKLFKLNFKLYKCRYNNYIYFIYYLLSNLSK